VRVSAFLQFPEVIYRTDQVGITQEPAVDDFRSGDSSCAEDTVDCFIYHSDEHRLIGDSPADHKPVGINDNLEIVDVEGKHIAVMIHCGKRLFISITDHTECLKGIDIVQSGIFLHDFHNAADSVGAGKAVSLIFFPLEIITAQGREFSCGVIEGKALPVIEIAPLQGFYDYKNKYKAGSAVETCPADLPEEVSAQMRAYAEAVAKVIGLDTYSRSDFLISDAGEMYCLEANTLPGMTPTSLLPQEAAAVGMNFNQLCEKIIEISLKRYQK